MIVISLVGALVCDSCDLVEFDIGVFLGSLQVYVVYIDSFIVV